MYASYHKIKLRRYSYPLYERAIHSSTDWHRAFFHMDVYLIENIDAIFSSLYSHGGSNVTAHAGVDGDVRIPNQESRTN